LYSPGEIVATLRAGEPLPDRCVAVTFDDVYENNYADAVPILGELEIPATVFVATAYIGSGEPFPFDGWAKTRRDAVDRHAWLPISKESLSALSKMTLISIGPHTPATLMGKLAGWYDWAPRLQESMSSLIR
jgi:hypothetical protein